MIASLEATQSPRVENLTTGEIRMTAGGCAFLFKRLKPGVVFTAISGTDKGELGTVALDEISEEFARFRQPLAWFIDADQSPNVVSQVFEQWTGWLLKHQHIFKSIHVFTSDKAMSLNFSIARHLSSTSRLMVIDSERSNFEKAIISFSPGQKFDAEVFQGNWSSLPAIAAVRECLPDGTIQLTNSACTFTFKRIETNVIFTRITGVDEGSLGNLPLDYLRSELNLCTKPLTWFVDASATERIAPQVPETWAYWIASHQDNLERVVMLTAKGAVPLLIDIVKTQLKATTNIVVLQSQEQFEAAVKTKVAESA